MAEGTRILTGVALEGGTEVPADLVVVGIGAMPDVEIAAEAGLALDNGIAVDATLATSAPLYGGRRIRLESWRSAQEQGALAARATCSARARGSRACPGRTSTT